MKKIISSSLLIFIFCLSTLGQRSESDIALKEYFIDAEFFLAQEFYLDALNDYLQVYKRGYEDNANINYRIGICYLNIPGQKDKAIDYLLKAREKVSEKYKESSLSEKNAPVDVHLYLGNAYRVNNMLDKAIESYNTYKELIPEDEENLQEYANQQIEACNLASEFMNEPLSLDLKNLGEAVNTSNDDYKAVLSGDGKTMVYMHKLPFYDAVYVTRLENGEWTQPENITPQLMSDGDQFVSSISYDGNTLYLTKEDEFNSDILVSNFVDGRWQRSVLLSADINTKYWESHASLSKDGKRLYFTSNRRGGVGEMDIYYCNINEDGTYGPAVNLEAINTDLNEDTPFITENDSLLFFSSQGFTSMGGYDIFVSKKGPDETWGLPQNLGYPLSTTDDDLFYYPVNNGQSALVSKIDPDGYGGSDIYAVDFKEYPDYIEAPTEEPMVEPVEMVEQAPEPDAEVVVAPLPVVTAEDVTEVEDVEEAEEAEEAQVEAPEVAPVVTTVEIAPLLFGFDKSLITSEGKQKLDKIAKLMEEHPDINLVLTGFTDPLGPESYNLRLSELRARAALGYLTSKGIDGARLKAVGKGETNFIAINTNSDGSDNPTGRSFNRRVEFEISGAEPALIIKRIDPVPPKLKIK